MLETLYKIVERKKVSNDEILTLMGRINHYFPLITGAKFERHWLAALGDSQKPKGLEVTITDLAKDQARWWIWNLLANQEWTRIPDIRNIFPSNVTHLYPDAAGGSDVDIRRGLGGCVWQNHSNIPWVYLPWSRLIRNNQKNWLGDKFAKKLSMLEGVAALALLCSEPTMLRGKNVKVWTDNAGLVYCFRKGNSSCPYTMTIIKALDAVARALDITLILVKTPRVSGTGEFVADALSKGRIEEALSQSSRFNRGPSEIPRTLIRWLEHPEPSRLLGQAIAEEMSAHTEVLRWSLEKESEIRLITRSGKRKPQWAD